MIPTWALKENSPHLIRRWKVQSTSAAALIFITLTSFLPGLRAAGKSFEKFSSSSLLTFQWFWTIYRIVWQLGPIARIHVVISVGRYALRCVVLWCGSGVEWVQFQNCSVQQVVTCWFVIILIRMTMIHCNIWSLMAVSQCLVPLCVSGSLGDPTTSVQPRPPSLCCTFFDVTNLSPRICLKRQLN